MDISPESQIRPCLSGGIVAYRSHLVWLAPMLLDLGAMSMVLYAFRERELLSISTRPAAVSDDDFAYSHGGLAHDSRLISKKSPQGTKIFPNGSKSTDPSDQQPDFHQSHQRGGGDLG